MGIEMGMGLETETELTSGDIDVADIADTTDIAGITNITETITELTEAITETITITMTEAVTEALETTARTLNTGSTGNMLNSGGSGNLIMIYYFFVVALIIAALFFFRKYLLRKTGANRLSSVKSGAYLKVIDRLVLSPDKHIILVETGNKILLVGVSPQSMDTLARFSKEEFGDIGDNTADDSGAADADNGFLAMLSGRFKFRDGGKN